jgi:hypothetical protein
MKNPAIIIPDVMQGVSQQILNRQWLNGRKGDAEPKLVLSIAGRTIIL